MIGRRARYRYEIDVDPNVRRLLRDEQSREDERGNGTVSHSGSPSLYKSPLPKRYYGGRRQV
jgi:hypothetical protein